MSDGTIREKEDPMGAEVTCRQRRISKERKGEKKFGPSVRINFLFKKTYSNDRFVKGVHCLLNRKRHIQRVQ